MHGFLQGGAKLSNNKFVSWQSGATRCSRGERAPCHDSLCSTILHFHSQQRHCPTLVSHGSGAATPMGQAGTKGEEGRLRSIWAVRSHYNHHVSDVSSTNPSQAVSIFVNNLPSRCSERKSQPPNQSLLNKNNQFLMEESILPHPSAQRKRSTSNTEEKESL